MVSGANVVGINCTNGEIATPSDFSTGVMAPLQGWLSTNATKHPLYLILFQDIPSRVSIGEDGAYWAGVQYQLSTELEFNQIFVTSINMNGTGGTNDCIAYIKKVAAFGSNDAPGKLIIGAHAAGYANTNYYFDDTRYGYGSPSPSRGSIAESGVLAVNPTASVTYSNAIDYGLGDHITNGANLAGYLCWGGHSSLVTSNQTGWTFYPTNGFVKWTTNAQWWTIRTVESYNGWRDAPTTGLASYLMWFSSNAFGGTGYAGTPVGAISYVEEPQSNGTFDDVYFGYWEMGRIFASCAWNSVNTNNLLPNLYLQAVGDPFVRK